MVKCKLIINGYVKKYDNIELAKLHARLYLYRGYFVTLKSIDNEFIQF